MYHFRIKNKKLAAIACIFILLFASLGCWQLARSHQKQKLLDDYAARTSQAPLGSEIFSTQEDLRFYRVTLTGKFDNQHSFLLDNKIFHGRVGYELYTPFTAVGVDKSILIDRGFIPLGQNRKTLPGINTVIGNITIVGMLNLPPRYVALGSMIESQLPNWPLRIEFIQLRALSELLNVPLYPYILTLEPHHPAAYSVEWQIVTMPPERHIGYAVQWFALALTLLIIFVLLNFERRTKE